MKNGDRQSKCHVCDTNQKSKLKSQNSKVRTQKSKLKSQNSVTRTRRRIYIFTDNLYALNVSIGKWKAKAHRPLIATIQKLITDLRRSSFLTIGWVPGHADVEGNEAADKVAKLGAQACSPDQIPTPMRTAQPNPDRTLPTRLSPSEEAPSLPPSPQPLRRSLRPHTQPRALARGIDFSSFHAPKRRAHPPTECPHGVPLLLDRRSTAPPVPSLYHTLAPRRLSIPHQAKDGRLCHRP